MSEKYYQITLAERKWETIRGRMSGKLLSDNFNTKRMLGEMSGKILSVNFNTKIMWGLLGNVLSDDFKQFLFTMSSYNLLRTLLGFFLYNLHHENFKESSIMRSAALSLDVWSNTLVAAGINHDRSRFITYIH